MATIACPNCGLPRAVNVAHTPCPICSSASSTGLVEQSANVFQDVNETDAATTRSAQLPADASELPSLAGSIPRGHRPEIIASVIGLLAGIAGTITFQSIMPLSPDQQFTALHSQPSQLESPPPSIRVVTSADQQADIPDDTDNGSNLNHVTALRTPPLPLAVEFPELAQELPAGEQPSIVVDFNLPKASVTISRYMFTSAKQIKLRGTVRHATFFGLEGLHIDASELSVVESITLSGKLTNTILKLNCPSGKIVINSQVSDESELELDTHNGEVSFNPSSSISGGAKVRVTASKMEIRGTVSGKGTYAHITFAPGGILRGSAIRDHAVVEYRKANPNDPPIHVDVSPSSIDASAILRRVDDSP